VLLQIVPWPYIVRRMWFEAVERDTSEEVSCVCNIVSRLKKILSDRTHVEAALMQR